MATYQELLNLFNTLSDQDKAQFLGECINYVNKNNIPKQSLANNTMFEEIENIRFDNGRVCPFCGSVHIVRNGHIKNDKNTQRFLCKDCKKSFVISSNSVVSRTRKELGIWQKYIECMIDHKSVRKSARICGIHRNTAFIWRHKILDSLQEMQSYVKMKDIVEADETYFEVSYKGNHKGCPLTRKEDFVAFDFGRLAHHRGKCADSYHFDKKQGKYVADKKKRGLSNNQVCVPCAVTRNGLSVAKVGKLGKADTYTIDKILGDKITSTSTLCTDKEKAYRPFAKEKDIKLVQLEGHQTKNGIYHIQTINNYHTRLKNFVMPFKGVATKYLNNYLVWFNYLNNTKGDEEYKEQSLMNYILKHPITTTKRELSHRPALPLVA